MLRDLCLSVCKEILLDVPKQLPYRSLLGTVSQALGFAWQLLGCP